MNNSKCFTSPLLGLQKFIKGDGPARILEVRFCAPCHIGDILALQETVYAGIENKAAFVPTSREELSESLEEDLCVGIFDGDLLAAFSLLVVNRHSPRSLGVFLGYGPDQCRFCATYDTTFIHPGYRGYGIQRFFIDLKNELCAKMGVREAFATVSPENAHSLNNLLGTGFEILRETTLYGGYRRYVLRRPLEGDKV